MPLSGHIYREELFHLSSVVSTMVKYSSTPIRTFAVGFDEEKYSELGFA